MRDRKQRKYGQDQPWREERRLRYPDEPYGGRGSEPRRDVGPESYGEPDRMDWNESRWNRGASFGFGAEEDIERGGNYAYGSPYGQGDMGSDRAGRGDWNDSDWMANRPARGRGTWAGDWSMSGENYSGRGPKDYRRSDDRIREEVCDIFTEDARLDATDVAVRVEGCEVTLTGNVTTREQKRRAEELAERVRGVNDVHNQLRVVRSEAVTGMSGAQPAPARGGRASQSSIAHDRDRDR